MEELERLSKSELLYLSNLIDRLNNEIVLEERTISDIKLSIRHCLEERSREG